MNTLNSKNDLLRMIKTTKKSSTSKITQSKTYEISTSKNFPEAFKDRPLF